jgi:hypothetical protein
MVGSVLTLTNSLGFAISICSMLWFTHALQWATLSQLLPWLALGPMLGLWSMRRLVRDKA